MNQQSLLHHAAKQASSRPAFVACALVQYQQAHSMSDTELASWLEMVPEKLPELALCLRPTTQQQVQQVSDYAGCSAERLARVLQV